MGELRHLSPSTGRLLTAPGVPAPRMVPMPMQNLSPGRSPSRAGGIGTVIAPTGQVMAVDPMSGTMRSIGSPAPPLQMQGQVNHGQYAPGQILEPVAMPQPSQV